MTTSSTRPKTKKCPSCKADVLRGEVRCGQCGHKFPPRVLHYHELKPLLLERFGGTPRLNVRTGAVLINGEAYTADQIERIYLSLSNEREQWPIKPTSDAIWAMAEANQWDPVVDYLEGLADHTPLPMEQWKRLDHWLLGIHNPVAADFLQQYFVSAVARALQPGCEARCSPVLVGPQQRGKTTLGRILFGDEHWVEGLQDLSRDARMRCQMAWGVELSELDGITRRADIESLKTFLSEREDTFRKPYGRGVEKHDRRHVFWGTANGSPLRDLSGNTRFLCIGLPDKMLPLDWAISHRNALWARAVEQFGKGFNWTQVSERQRDERIVANLDFQEVDPWSDILGPLLRRNPNGVITYAELYQKLEVPVERQNNANARRIKQLVGTMGWEYGQRRRSGEILRGFWRQDEPVKTQEGEDGLPF